MKRTPLYQRIADDLRASIDAGDLVPGMPLPPARELMARYATSKSTVENALGLLRAEGLIESQQGRDTRVRRRDPVRRISSERYRVDIQPQETPQTSFTAERGLAWQDYQLDRVYTWIEADARLAELFGVEPGTRVLERRFVFYDNGRPSQMSRPCLLASDVEGTPVADPDREPWPGGTFAQLRSIGIVVDDVTESVSARMPTKEEADTLNIGKGVPVFAIVRRLLAQGRVVEVADPIVIPADQVILDYRIRLGGT
ncbi:GntR family transcriptional regulator [Nonomuraea bangladeshensis]|uniref:GntR family transcriptional regulator n=1 Tax=Nonomuraea bangladeshensis TaxID=404385 RepID=UPI003C2D3C39